jgi:hypothetical protein
MPIKVVALLAKTFTDILAYLPLYTFSCRAAEIFRPSECLVEFVTYASPVFQTICLSSSNIPAWYIRSHVEFKHDTQKLRYKLKLVLVIYHVFW